MSGLSNLFYRQPRLLALTLLLIVVAGVASLQLLPRAEDPELLPRNVQIFTAFPGADAIRTEALVTDVIEDMLAEYQEIKEIKSFSRAGLSTIFIELLDRIDDVEGIWTEMRDDLADIEKDLPTGAGTPDFIEFELAAFTLLVGLTWDLESPPERAILGRLGEELADALRAVPGTNDVVLHGQPREEVLVELDAAGLAARGLTVAAVSAAIRGTDAKVSAGEVVATSSEVQLEVSGEIDSLDAVREIVVLESENGDSFVRVGDLGTVSRSEVTPKVNTSIIGGEPGVVVAARMETGRRVDVWSERAKAIVESYADDLPHGVEAEVLFDQSRYTRERLGDLITNFVMGAGLVMVVMVFTMGWRAALIVGSSLPLTTLMVLQGIRMLGIPLHQMSITGMIIAIGLLIDNAIVVVDEVRHRTLDGESPAVAVSGAVQHLAVPLFGSTLTTCLAFAPIALMPGGAGEFVGPIAISVMLAVGSSLFLALTITPALAGLLDRFVPPKKRTGALANGLSIRPLDRPYQRTLRFLYERPLLGIGVAVVAPVLGFLAATRMPEQFFPPADRDQFNVQIYLERTATLDATRTVATRAREIALEHPRVERVHLFLGESSPKVYYNLVEAQRDAAYYAQMLVELDGPEDSIRVVREIQRDLDENLTEAVVLAHQIEQGPPFDAPVEMHLYGPDLGTLREYGEKIRATLASLPDVTHVRSTLEGGAPKLAFELDDEAARLAGVDNVGVATALAARLTGVPGGSLIEATEELPVRVRMTAAERGDLERIETTEILTPAGWTPLSSLGEFELIPETASIAHRNRRRVHSTQGFLQAGTLPSEVLGDLEAALAERDLDLPDGFEMEVGGESAKRDEAVGNLASSAALLLVVMAAALVLTFDSFLLAAVIGLVGLLSVGLALLAVGAYGAPFGFMTIIGAMGLIGVAINDSIVVLAALEEDTEASRGDTEAAVRIVRRATRHVLSTSLTTIAGFTPLILAGGAFWPPLAVAIAGGVTGATLIAVTLVPTLHGVVKRRKKKAKRAD